MLPIRIVVPSPRPASYRSCHQFSCRSVSFLWLLILTGALTSCVPPPQPATVVTVLAPDVTIHLGDDRSPPPGWIALYNRLIPSPVWVSTFYLPDSRGTWELSALVQAGREPTAEVLLNGHQVEPRYIEPADPANILAWRAITATVPVGTLQTGPNEILIRVGQHPPFRQQAGDLWDDLQFRGVFLTPSIETRCCGEE